MNPSTTESSFSCTWFSQIIVLDIPAHIYIFFGLKSLNKFFQYILCSVKLCLQTGSERPITTHNLSSPLQPVPIILQAKMIFLLIRYKIYILQIPVFFKFINIYNPQRQSLGGFPCKCVLKGATKFYFMHSLCVVIIMFNTD